MEIHLNPETEITPKRTGFQQWSADRRTCGRHADSVAHSQVLELKGRTRTARLPERWSLETFPFDRQPGVSRKQIRAFAEPNTLVHAGHMSLAQLYEDEGKFAEAEIHYKAALAEARKNGSISRSRFLVFYFYVVGKVLHRSAAAQRGGTAISKGVGNF